MISRDEVAILGVRRRFGPVRELSVRVGWVLLSLCCAHSRALPLGISQALGPARKGKGPVLLTRKAPAGCAGCQEINYYCLLPQRTCPDFKQPKSIVSSLALLRFCIAQHIKGAQSRTDARGQPTVAKIPAQLRAWQPKPNIV